jgi:hypothetical protein
MGKRELLLILAFIVAGALLYQVTAPPREGAGRGFSIRQLFDNVRRELRAHSASAEHRLSEARPIGAAIREVRVLIGSGDLTIAGTDRADLAVEALVHSTGEDPAEAERLARRTSLRADAAGDVLTVTLDYPREGRQRPLDVRLEVPRSLRVRVESRRGRLEVRDAAEVQLVSLRGEARLQEIAGPVRIEHRDGPVVVEGADAVRLTARNSVVRLRGIRGESSVTLIGGELEAQAPGGPLEIDAQRAPVRIASPGATVRLTLTDGEAAIEGVRHELRFDGRRAPLILELAAGAPVTAFTTDERIELKLLPGAGVTLDALATDGAIHVGEAHGAVEIIRETEQTTRARGALAGGGPDVTLRTTRGNISIR